MFDQRVPASWTNVAYPSLKPLGPWFKDLMQRLDFITTWIDKGIPSSYWISGFFFPQGFTTAILQNYARKYKFPIDTVSFSFVMRDELPEELTRPDDGCYVFGLFLEGARWDKKLKSVKNYTLFFKFLILHYYILFFSFLFLSQTTNKQTNKQLNEWLVDRSEAERVVFSDADDPSSSRAKQSYTAVGHIQMPRVQSSY